MSLIIREEPLAHFGVKGMHWGVRRTHLTPTQERKQTIAKLTRKRESIDGNKAVRGFELQGWILKKMAKKDLKKNPNFTFGKLSEIEKRARIEKASRVAKRRIIARGAAETAIILGGGLLAVNQVKASPRTIRGAQMSVGILGAKGGLSVISEVNAIRTAQKLQRLENQIADLQKR